MAVPCDAHRPVIDVPPTKHARRAGARARWRTGARAGVGGVAQLTVPAGTEDAAAVRGPLMRSRASRAAGACRHPGASSPARDLTAAGLLLGTPGGQLHGGHERARVEVLAPLTTDPLADGVSVELVELGRGLDSGFVFRRTGHGGLRCSASPSRRRRSGACARRGRWRRSPAGLPFDQLGYSATCAVPFRARGRRVLEGATGPDRRRGAGLDEVDRRGPRTACQLRVEHRV